MKKQTVIILLIGLVVSACDNPTKDDPKTITTNTSPPANAEIIKSAKQDNNDQSSDDWQRYQDSIRNTILARKENKGLKNSILQEAYIKDVVKLKSDTLFFLLPFNLHGFDCLAPDCYSTDLMFNFKVKDSLRFPDKLPFTIHEHGCVEKETNLSGLFQLMESNNNFITYHSFSNKSTLVILKTNIYYFVGVGPETIKGNSIQKIFDEYKEEDPKSVAPYSSTIMSKSEYEFFLDKKDLE